MKKRVCLVAATPLTFHLFMKPHLDQLSVWADVTILFNPNYHVGVQPVMVAGNVKHIEIARKISFPHDLISFIKIVLFFQREKFDAVITLVPKAGLLGSVAGWLCGIKTRIHIFQGEVWFTKSGLTRTVLKTADKVIAFMSSHLLCVSDSQCKFLFHQNICKHEKLNILGHGSITGVDTQRFCPNTKFRSKIRENFGIPTNACVILFVGRIVREKGLVELVEAFNHLRKTHEDLTLMLVGPDDEGLAENLRKITKSENRDFLILCGLSNSPEKFMAAADIFCLPSHREGFGMAALEASSCALPVVGTEIHGLSDAVINDKTGILVPVSNHLKLCNALAKLIQNPKLRKSYGNAGRKRVIKDFEHRKVIDNYSDFFRSIIEKN